METMIYFLVKSGTLILLLAGTFFLLGLWSGWFIWGKFRDKWQLGEQALSGLRSRLNSTLHGNTQLEQQLEKSKKEAEQLREDGQQHQGLRQEFVRVEAELLIEKGKNDTLNADLSTTAGRAEDAEVQLRRIRLERDTLKEEYRKQVNLEPEVNEPASAAMPTAMPLIQVMEESANTRPVTNEKREDETLGWLYLAKPEETDDLNLLKGVGAVMHQKLNAQGVYTFRQISQWNEASIEAFGLLLKTGDRIHRDDWKSQAKRLQEEKYGEEL